jgi:tellurite resistance protein
VAYVKLNGGIDNFAHILYYSALFLILLMIVQLPRFRKLPFFVSWWAYSFPLAAFTIGTEMMLLHSNSLFFHTLSLFSLTVLSLLLALLVLKTIRGLITGALLQPE